MLLSSTDYNIQLGTAYFQRLYAIYGSYPLAVAAYNAGGGNVNKWLAANGDPRSGSGRLGRLDRGDPVRRDQALRPARARECRGLRPDQPAARDLDRQCAAELVSRQQAAGLSPANLTVTPDLMRGLPPAYLPARRFRDGGCRIKSGMTGRDGRPPQLHHPRRLRDLRAEYEQLCPTSGPSWSR